MASKDIETWREVPGFQDYEVSDHGRLWSMPRHRVYGKFVTGTLRYQGSRPRQVQVQLWRDGEGKFFYLHQIVLLSFSGPCPDGFEGCHNDGDVTNNRLSNLRWDTHKSNVQDSIRHGTWNHLPPGIGVKNGRAKLSEADVLAIRAFRFKRPNRDLAKQHGVSLGLISMIHTRAVWKHI